MYISSFREDKLTRLFKQKGILSVSDLSILNLAEVFNIQIRFHPFRSQCFFDHHCAVIYLNNQQNIKEQRSDFFHELAHYFEHTGDQRDMEKLFVELQEQQAKRFALYASMPRYIFEPIMNQANSLSELEDTFQLPLPMIKERVQMIKMRNTTHTFYLNLSIQEHKQVYS